MKKFKYKTIEIDVAEDPETKLNELGEIGWELVLAYRVSERWDDVVEGHNMSGVDYRNLFILKMEVS